MGGAFSGADEPMELTAIIAALLFAVRGAAVLTGLAVQAWVTHAEQMTASWMRGSNRKTMATAE